MPPVNEPPTLPPPPMWRLAIAGIVIAAVLYGMYAWTAAREEPAPPTSLRPASIG